MITCIFGKQGSGKTLYLVRQGRRAQLRGKKVFSNFKLKIPHTLITFEDMKNCKLSNCILLVDEAHLWGLNARQSNSKKNILITSQFIPQLRKKSVDAYFTTQYPRQIDVRVRENADYFCWCKKYLFDPYTRKLGNVQQSKILNPKVRIIIEVELLDLSEDKDARMYFIGNQFYKYYDTEEVIKVQDE